MKTRLALLALLTWVALAAFAVTQVPPTEQQMLDEMDDVSMWKSLASDGVIASVHGAKGVQGGALVLEFDFAKTAGYAAATRKLDVELPDDYEISFWMRGESGRNNLEIKFVDASGDNVWWFRRTNYAFSGDWQNIRIKRRQMEFAWGTTLDRTLRRFASIEFVVSAGADGGTGNLWFDRLALKPRVHVPATEKPTVTASSERPGNDAARVLDGKDNTAWRSVRRVGSPQSLVIDLKEIREFGGIEIDWLPNLQASHYSIELSLDGSNWETVRNVTAGNGGRDSHMLPDSEARWIRLTMPDEGRDVGIREIHIRDLEFGASTNAFVQTLAQRARQGCYPRAFLGQQSYWTIVGVDGDSEESLLSEDGAIEARKAGYSVEPFLELGNELITWADVAIQQSLADNYLPLPTVRWQHKDIELQVTAVAMGERGDARTRMQYRVTNPSSTAQRVTLALAVRPFQVNPPAQFLNTAGGVSPIQDLAWQQGAVSVNGIAGVLPQSPPQAFRAVPFDADTPCEWLRMGSSTDSVHDETGLASGALLYEMNLAPGAHQDVMLDLPLHTSRHKGPGVSREMGQGGSSGEGAAPVSTQTFASVAAEWREKLNRVELQLPADGQGWFDTLRSSLAYVLINRDGPGIQPGSRSYERSWIRDGAMTSQMLLQLGHAEDAREFLLWFAGYQFENGKIPCCVDVRGADPVPENDSTGEFLFLVNEVYRYTGDAALLRQLWPRVLKAVAYMDKLRLSQRTEQNKQGERAAFYGLMPASISHEGYSAKPMHSYWDNFWALAGYEAAVGIARTLDERSEMRRFIDSRDEFRADLYRSLQVAMREHKIDYLPGAAELGDFDPTSTSIAIAPVGEQQMLPPDALLATFERYWKHFQQRQQDKTWDVYTPYELRNLATFVRLGWRERGVELLQFFMADRRPAAWNHWAEVVGREPRKSRFIGDMPHGWVASDYGRSLLEMFAYERPADETLVLMAGVPQRWTEQDGFAVNNLRTPYGKLSYSLKIDGQRRVLEIGELKKLPPGGVAVSWPQRPTGTQTITTGTARWFDNELRVVKLPLRIEFRE